MCEGFGDSGGLQEAGSAAGARVHGYFNVAVRNPAARYQITSFGSTSPQHCP